MKSKLGLGRGALIASMALWALLGLFSPAAAQDVDTDDVQELAGEVAGKDPRQVLDALKTPIEDDDLPDGYADATYIGGDATPEAEPAPGAPPLGSMFSEADFEGAIGVVPFSLTAESQGDDGEATLPAGLPDDLQSFEFYAIFFIVFEDEAAAANALGDALSQGSMGDDGFQVEEHEDFGVPSIAAGGSMTQEGVSAALGLNAVQVGNVMVMGLALEYGLMGGELDPEASQSAADDLVAVGVNHLDATVAAL